MSFQSFCSTYLTVSDGSAVKTTDVYNLYKSATNVNSGRNGLYSYIISNLKNVEKKRCMFINLTIISKDVKNNNSVKDNEICSLKAEIERLNALVKKHEETIKNDKITIQKLSQQTVKYEESNEEVEEDNSFELDADDIILANNKFDETFKSANDILNSSFDIQSLDSNLAFEFKYAIEANISKINSENEIAMYEDKCVNMLAKAIAYKHGVYNAYKTDFDIKKKIENDAKDKYYQIVSLDDIINEMF